MPSTIRLLAASAALSLAACTSPSPQTARTPSGEPGEPSPPAASQPAKTTAPPARPPVREYAYVAADKRDPFREELPNVLPPADPACGSACTWEIDQLVLVALVTGTATPMAMVEAPDGKGYVLEPGSSVGKHHGKVAEIHGGRLLVDEPCVQDGKIAWCRKSLGSPEPKPPTDENLLRPDKDR